jgi:O-succinylbenzoic acid--CoA ligase
MHVEAWLTRAARSWPRRVALETSGARCSYAELLESAATMAQGLVEAGAEPGSKVALALPPGRRFADVLHACFLLGAIAVPVDLRMSAQEQRLIVTGAAVVADEEWVASVRAEGASTRTAERLVSTSHDLAAPAVVIHTSGTSSAPRPIELTYGNLLWSALGSAVALGLDPHERWLCALPLSHVGGLSILVRSAIYGTTAVVHERFETERVLYALRHQGVTLVSLVATTLARLLDAGLEHPPVLRCALTGGGPVPAALVERAVRAGIPVSMTYGLTESCSQVTTAPVAALGEGELGAGPPLFCTGVRCAEDGEILISGPTVGLGALAEDGWLHTGDIGSLDERGQLSVTGRKADTIVSGGENVAPSEVEAVLEAHPDVIEAGVVGRADPEWGEAVTAIVVPREGAALEGPSPGHGPADDPALLAASLRAHCAAALAPYKVPKQFLLRSEPLPRTRSGKLLRREL